MNETNGTYENIEHHAMLTFDEPSRLAELFTQNIEKLTIDLRGRTTVSRNKTRQKDLGIKRLSHVYLDVDANDVVIDSTDTLKKLLAGYEREGVTNLYIVRLVVHWNNGDMQEWKRHVIHTKDKDINRDIPSQRDNVLAIKLGTYEGVCKLQELYPANLVRSTLCEIVKQEKTDLRICKGTVAGS